MSANHWIFSFLCEDKPGIVHALSGAILRSGGNITESQQFASADSNRFFMRLQVESDTDRGSFEAELERIVRDFEMEWHLDDVGRPLRTLILGTTAPHCVADLLYRQRAGQLSITVPRVLANHPDLGALAEFYGVPFEHLPITDTASKAAFEARVLELVEQERIELVVLARYMQILSPELCRALEGRAINIHHSFLPGFKGANPYRQAHARGVKLIGATAHFVTTDLDEGPIIEQNVTRVEHSDSPERLIAVGQDVESRTLRQAVSWFAEHRVLLDGNRTVIFR